MTRQLTTLIFVLITIMSVGCLRIHNADQMVSKTDPLPTPEPTHITPTPEPTPTPLPTPAPTPVPIDQSRAMLGSAADFAVLAGSTCTSAGKASNVVGSVGVSPGTAITGVINIVGGSKHSGDSVSLKAQADATTAYNTLASHNGAINITGKELGGITLGPGVYKFNSSCAITSGTLTLDGQGNPLAQWIFQIGSTITTGLKTNVNMINMGSPFNVYWQVGSSATISGTTMCGNIIAYASITLNSSVDLKGRALARGGAVTLIEDNIAMK